MLTNCRHPCKTVPIQKACVEHSPDFAHTDTPTTQYFLAFRLPELRTQLCCNHHTQPRTHTTLNPTTTHLYTAALAFCTWLKMRPHTYELSMMRRLCSRFRLLARRSSQGLARGEAGKGTGQGKTQQNRTEQDRAGRQHDMAEQDKAASPIRPGDTGLHRHHIGKHWSTAALDVGSHWTTQNPTLFYNTTKP